MLKSRDLVKHISKPGEKPIMKMGPPLLDKSHIDPTYPLSTVCTEVFKFVMVIPWKVPEYAAKLVLHSILDKEEMLTFSKSIYGRFEHAHNSTGSHSKPTVILMKIFGILIFAMFKRANAVSIPQWHIVDSTHILKNLLVTCNKSPWLDGHLFVIIDLPCGLTWISQYDKADPISCS
jgi:hypothetical protein